MTFRKISLCTTYMYIKPLLHRVFIDHDIISILGKKLKKIKKNLGKILNTFENIMENGAFAPKEQMLHST